MNNQALQYLQSPVLQKAKQTIRNPENGKHFEHHVGTWLGTLLKNVFAGDPWAYTPEKIDVYTNKKPDFLIEKLEDDNFSIHLVCEIKKHKGDRMEKALNQAVKDIQETIDEKGNITDSAFEVFVLVQRGMDIGFFEYHNDESNLDEENIDHFRGCVSLTQRQDNGRAVISSNTPRLKMLMFDDYRLQTLNDTEEERLREDARNYRTPCIFNLDYHEDEINKMMDHILRNKPRSSI
jgi:hypothetical protein